MTGHSLPVVLSAVLAAGAVALLAGPRPRLRAESASGAPRADVAGDDPGLLIKGRWLWTLLAAVAGPVFVDGPAGMFLGLAVGAGAWVAVGRSEPAGRRREREAVRADLPALVLLLAAALRSGAAPSAALGVVADALPGPGADRLSEVRRRLELGVDPVEVWRGLADQPELLPLARTMARATESGTSVADAVTALADSLGEAARSQAEDRARGVGVRAAVPLGVCLLPAFLLLGIVPMVVSMADALRW